MVMTGHDGRDAMTRLMDVVRMDSHVACAGTRQPDQRGRVRDPDVAVGRRIRWPAALVGNHHANCTTACRRSDNPLGPWVDMRRAMTFLMLASGTAGSLLVWVHNGDGAAAWQTLWNGLSRGIALVLGLWS